MISLYALSLEECSIWNWY